MSAAPGCLLGEEPHKPHELASPGGAKPGVRCDGTRWPCCRHCPDDPTCPGLDQHLEPCPTPYAPDVEDVDDLPTATSYVVEYAWDCDCGETNGTADLDVAGSVQVCEGCGQRTRVTT